LVLPTERRNSEGEKNLEAEALLSANVARNVNKKYNSGSVTSGG